VSSPTRSGSAGRNPHLPIMQIAYEPGLPFEDEEFDTVLPNAVLEHIPQPRDARIRDLWRVLKSGGVLIINETPNKYFPKETHTTGLWFNHWLPRDAGASSG
jgi:ubiquinone/menaquinone biosynthesis C-methylase UbiE